MDSKAEYIGRACQREQGRKKAKRAGPMTLVAPVAKPLLLIYYQRQEAEKQSNFRWVLLSEKPSTFSPPFGENRNRPKADGYTKVILKLDK